MSNLNEAIERLKAHTPRTSQDGEGKPSWLPLAEEVRDKLNLLLTQLYSEVPEEIQKFHRGEMSHGTNWELTAWACGKNRRAFRMSWGDQAAGMVRAIIQDVEDEAREKSGCGPDLRLARMRAPEEEAEMEGKDHNEWVKQAQARHGLKEVPKENIKTPAAEEAAPADKSAPEPVVAPLVENPAALEEQMAKDAKQTVTLAKGKATDEQMAVLVDLALSKGKALTLKRYTDRYGVNLPLTVYSSVKEAWEQNEKGVR